MRRAALLAMTLLAVGGCVSKLAVPRVRAALVDAGLSDANAACMASRMTDRLSIGQLRRLQTISASRRSMSEFVGAVHRLGDSEMFTVTTSAAALCASGLAPEKR